MAYTKEEIINKCNEAFKNPSTFYQADVINYRGKTADGILYNEIVAKFVCDNFDKLTFEIEKITREEAYKTQSHNGEFNPNSKREEEITAIKMFNRCKNGSVYDFIGKIIDYQTPLKNTSKDEAGKIDLLSYDGKTLRILELKKKDSKETMLRCVLEGFTYLCTVNQAKVLKDFCLPDSTEIVACPFVFFDEEQHKEMKEDRPWLKKAMMLMNSKPYYIKEENGYYKVVED